MESIIRKWKNEDWTEFSALSHIETISQKPLIVIGGCARSGTTLLRVILDSHPDILCGAYSNIFIPIQLDFTALSFNYELDEILLRNLNNQCKDRVEFIDKFIEIVLKDSNKSLFCEKTARNILMFEWILNHFPNVKLIHVIRDGLDVVCSLRTHRKRKIIDDEFLPTGNIIPLNHCIDRWKLCITSGIKSRGLFNYIEVKYEDIVLQTSETILALCKYLNISFDSSMLYHHEFNGPTRNPYKFPQNIEAKQPIFSSSINRYKNDLTEEELKYVLLEIEPLRHLLGYK